MRSRSFRFEGHDFAVHRGVFDPVRHLSGIAFASQLEDLIAECAPGASAALDLGTGCGLHAATMARLGISVVATDVSRAAVRSATQNCQGLDVDVRSGDMFAPVAGERFDLVVVNPPYRRARAIWPPSRSLTSPDFLEKFGAQVHDLALIAVVGFPADDASVLDATGLDLTLWRTVGTSGHDLGIFVSTPPSAG